MEWTVEFHTDFLKDLENLSKANIEIFWKKLKKIKSNPLRLKHLSGGSNCYREKITTNIRLVYHVESAKIWLLTIGRHDQAYTEFTKRLYSLREQLPK